MLSLEEKSDVVFRISISYILIFIMFILGIISFSTPLYSTIEIPFIFMVLYYWAVYRPAILPPLLIFIIGLTYDFLSGFPIGISSFIFIILYKSVSSQRHIIIDQPFIVIWLAYVVVSSASLLAQWGLFGLLNFQWTPFMPVILAIIAGGLLFPIIAFIFTLSNRLLPTFTDHYSAVK